MARVRSSSSSINRGLPLAIAHRLRLLILAVGVGIGPGLLPPATSAQAPAGRPRLEGYQLRVAPTVLQSGGTVNVEAVIVNRGDAPVHDLRVGTAVAGAGPSGRSWTLLEQSPSEPIPILAPGEEVRFRARVRLDGDGWFQVGIIARGADAGLAPRGDRVHVLQPAHSLVRAGTLFAIYSLLLGLLLAAAQGLFLPRGDTPRLIPDRRLLSVGVGLMVCGPTLLWLAHPRIIRHAGGPGLAPSWVLFDLPLAGVVLFAIGWMLAGAALRPRGQVWRGLLLVVIAYLVVGLAWVVIFNASLGTPPLVALREPGALFATLAWPLQVAQMLGWLNLGLR